MVEPVIAAIAAMSRNRVIGADNKLLWHIPDDFKHFKKTTMGKPVIMGRRTFESIGRPLPGRTNIVISRNPSYAPENVTVAASLDAAIDKAGDVANQEQVDEIFIIGGGQIYAEAMQIVDRIYLTVVDLDFEGDTSFPPVREEDWDRQMLSSGTEPVPYTIFVFNRKK